MKASFVKTGSLKFELSEIKCETGAVHLSHITRVADQNVRVHYTRVGRY